jgi:hypothetical protein
MSLGLYLSRVRSSDLLGRSWAEDEVVRFHIYFASRKRWVGKKPGLNKDSRNWTLEVRIRRKHIERFAEEIGAPLLRGKALPRYLAGRIGDLFDITAIPANLNEPTGAILRGMKPREFVERAFGQGDHAA